MTTEAAAEYERVAAALGHRRLRDGTADFSDALRAMRRGYWVAGSGPAWSQDYALGILEGKPFTRGPEDELIPGWGEWADEEGVLATDWRLVGDQFHGRGP